VGLRLVILPEVTKPENLGLVVRSAAGFGLDAVLLGPRCCDPLSRRAMRVSMGAVVQARMTRSADLAADLEALRARWGITRVAAVLDRRAERLSEFRWPRRAAVLVGNETAGLRDGWLSQCDRCVTIPMQAGVDSLNLGVAAGIFLYAMSPSGAGVPE
jgi:tRNA G18 (ribose-2'-O)-methylase SpoU